MKRGGQLRRTKRLAPRSKKRIIEDARWAAVRELVFRRDPDCVARSLVPEIRCAGPHDPDHVIPVGVAPQLRLDPNNVHRLCRAHHDWKHANPIAATAIGLRRWSWDGGAPSPGALWLESAAVYPDDETARTDLYLTLMRECGHVVKREPGDDSPLFACGWEPR